MAIKQLKNGCNLIDESSCHHTYGGSENKLDEKTIHLLDGARNQLFDELQRIDDMCEADLLARYFDKTDLLLRRALTVK